MNLFGQVFRLGKVIGNALKNKEDDIDPFAPPKLRLRLRVDEHGEEYEPTPQEQDAAATIIQSHWRRYAAKEELLNLKYQKEHKGKQRLDALNAKMLNRKRIRSKGDAYLKKLEERKKRWLKMKNKDHAEKSKNSAKTVESLDVDAIEDAELKETLEEQEAAAKKTVVPKHKAVNALEINHQAKEEAERKEAQEKAAKRKADAEQAREMARKAMETLQRRQEEEEEAEDDEHDEHDEHDGPHEPHHDPDHEAHDTTNEQQQQHAERHDDAPDQAAAQHSDDTTKHVHQDEAGIDIIHHADHKHVDDHDGPVTDQGGSEAGDAKVDGAGNDHAEHRQQHRHLEEDQEPVHMDPEVASQAESDAVGREHHDEAREEREPEHHEHRRHADSADNNEEHVSQADEQHDRDNQHQHDHDHEQQDHHDEQHEHDDHDYGQRHETEHGHDEHDNQQDNDGHRRRRHGQGRHDDEDDDPEHEHNQHEQEEHHDEHDQEHKHEHEELDEAMRDRDQESLAAAEHGQPAKKKGGRKPNAKPNNKTVNKKQKKKLTEEQRLELEREQRQQEREQRQAIIAQLHSDEKDEFGIPYDPELRIDYEQAAIVFQKYQRGRMARRKFGMERDQQSYAALLTEVNENELMEMKLAFDIFDDSGDGRISIFQMGDLMHALGQFPSSRELQHMMEELDASQMGDFAFTEFVEWYRKRRNLFRSEDVMHELFSAFDRDNNGYIAVSELLLTLNRLGALLTEEEASEMVRSLDSDLDGQVSFDEFCVMASECI